MTMLAKIEQIRRWIDATDDPALVDGACPHLRRCRASEEFLQKIAREVDSVMDDEAFMPPGGSMFVPSTFVVFLSSADDKHWQGDKRRGLAQGLAYTLRKKAQALCGRSQLKKLEFTVELRVDGTLEQRQFRVMALWDTEANQTSVGTFKSENRQGPFLNTPLENEATVAILPSEVTVANHHLHKVLYSIEVNRNGERQELYSVSKPEITIGRSSQSVPVDLPIRGDAEVSRLHAILKRDAQGGYWLTPQGRNPVFLNDHELQVGRRLRVNPEDDEIRICSFTLIIHSAEREAHVVCTNGDEERPHDALGAKTPRAFLLIQKPDISTLGGPKSGILTQGAKVFAANHTEETGLRLRTNRRTPNHLTCVTKTLSQQGTSECCG